VRLPSALTGPLLAISSDMRFADALLVTLRRHRIPCLSMDGCQSAAALPVEGFGAIVIDLDRAADWHVCGELAARAARKGVPVLATSDWLAPDGRYRRRAFALGCAAFIAKRGSPDRVIDALRRITDGERNVEVLGV